MFVFKCSAAMSDLRFNQLKYVQMICEQVSQDTPAQAN